MSAWLCSEEHLSLLANFASGGKQAFDLLLRENLRSLAHRYPGRDGEWVKAAKRFRYNPKAAPEIAASPILDLDPASVPVVVAMTLIVKQANCYDYQACENDDYPTTKAAQLVALVRNAALAHGGEDEGSRLYDEMPWGID